LVQLQCRETALTFRLGPEHPDLRENKAQIKRIQKELADVEAKELAASRLRLVADGFGAEHPAVKKLDGQLSRARKRLETAEGEYEMILGHKTSEQSNGKTLRK